MGGVSRNRHGLCPEGFSKLIGKDMVIVTSHKYLQNHSNDNWCLQGTSVNVPWLGCFGFLIN